MPQDPTVKRQPYTPGFYDLPALLRAKADGEEAALIPAPLDIHEPIFLVCHAAEGAALRDTLRIKERQDACEISDWYAEHFYFAAGDDGTIGVSLRYPEITETLPYVFFGHPAVLLFEHSLLLKFLHAHGISASQTLRAPTTLEEARSLAANLKPPPADLVDESLDPWVRRNLPTVSQLSQEPVRWLVDRMVPYGCLTMLSSKSGGQKSLFSLLLSQALSTGKNEFLGRQLLHDKRGFNVSDDGIRSGTFSRSTPVVYIDRENPEGEVSDRLRRMGVAANSNFIYWNDTKHFTPELDDPRLLEFARREGGFVIIDSLQDWYPANFNENDNAKIVELMGKFRRLARAGAGVLLLHHFAKYANESRGGTSFVALTDMAMKSNKREDGAIELREDRFRMCDAWELDFQIHFDAGELHGHAKHIQMQVLRDQLVREKLGEAAAEADEKRTARDAKDEADVGKVVTVIDERPDASPISIEKETGISRKRVEKLASSRGMTWSKEGKRWMMQEK